MTLAIHTYEKALILKSLLEAHGIDAYIQNVNQILPVVSAGVRVRIRERDLPNALGIVEAMNLNEAVAQEMEERDKVKTILVPVDFSDYSVRAYEMGFRMASESHAEVELLHAYYNPSFNTMPIGDVINYDGGPEEEDVKERVKQEIDKQKSEIDAKIAQGLLPRVNYRFVLREGIPEEEISRYAKNKNPLLIIMGTRGKDKKDQDLIGSVTAEIIDHSLVPVFAIPENTAMDGFEDVKSIAYATNFDDKDLVAFDKLMQLMKPFRFKIHFIHYLQKEDTWSEIKLSGIKEYFAKYYPSQPIVYDLLRGEDMLASIDSYIKQNKIDVIALTTHKRNIFTRLFNPSVARKMVFHSNTPMLVFHS